MCQKVLVPVTFRSSEWINLLRIMSVLAPSLYTRRGSTDALIYLENNMTEGYIGNCVLSQCACAEWVTVLGRCVCMSFTTFTATTSNEVKTLVVCTHAIGNEERNRSLPDIDPCFKQC